MKKIFFAIILCFSSSVVFAYDDMTVLSLNDFHGQMQPNGNMVGAAKIATFIKDYKKMHPNLVVVSAGDNYQGTAISNISHGKVVNEFFNYIDLKFSAVGNHEFDYGQEWFKVWSNNDFEYLASNIFYEGTEKLLDYTQPYGYQTFDNGKTIYFIGLATLETPETTAEKNISNLEFTNPATSSNKWIEYINNYEENGLPKPDAIVLLTHIPTEQDASGKIFYLFPRKELNNETEIDYVTKNVKGVSALISGHSHKLVNGFLNGEAVIQGASQGKDIGVLHYDCHTKENLCTVSPEVINLASATKNLENDPKVLEIIDKYYNQTKKKLNEVIATSAEALSNEPSDNGFYNIQLTYLIANIIKEVTNSDIALQNTYGVRRSLPAGQITYGMIYEALPFDNMVVTLKLKGVDVKKIVEHSLSNGKEELGVIAGSQIFISPNGDIQKILIDGKPIEDNRIYKVATVDFLATGGDSFDFSKMKDYRDTGEPSRDFVINYWKQNGVHLPESWKNIIITK